MCRWFPSSRNQSGLVVTTCCCLVQVCEISCTSGIQEAASTAVERSAMRSVRPSHPTTSRENWIHGEDLHDDANPESPPHTSHQSHPTSLFFYQDWDATAWREVSKTLGRACCLTRRVFARTVKKIEKCPFFSLDKEKFFLGWFEGRSDKIYASGRTSSVRQCEPNIRRIYTQKLWRKEMKLWREK